MLSILCALTVGVARDVDVASLKARASVACGTFSDHGGWELTGKCVGNGLANPYRFFMDGGERYVSRETGKLSTHYGFDGATAWTMGASGVPCEDSFDTRDQAQLVSWVFDGVWCLTSTPIEVTPDATGALSVTPTHGLEQATLTLDPKSGLPRSLEFESEGGPVTVTFSAYKRFGARCFPTHIATRGANADPFDMYVYGAKRVNSLASIYRMPSADESGATFDRHVSALVPIKRELGYTFIHPTINGKDVGWFLLDSGASCIVLDPSAAALCGATAEGHLRITGIGGTEEAKVVRTGPFRLGPLTIRAPVCYTTNVQSFMHTFPLKVGGVCGYGLMARTAVELDPYSTTMRLYPPGDAVLPTGGTWSGFKFTTGIMCLNCRYEGDREGWFMLDTGSGDAIDFTTREVEKNNLLTGRQTQPAQAIGVGGTEDYKSGSLAWFQLAGQKLTDLDAGFHADTKGAFASPYIAGVIGNQILSLFHTVIDYRRQRISLSWPR